MVNIIYVAIGGFFGSILRFAISSAFKKHPFGTWLANISGSLLLAVLFKYYQLSMIDDWMWLIGGVGFCGAYTTFSTFSNEVLVYITTGYFKNAVIYVASSLLSTLLLLYIVLLV